MEIVLYGDTDRRPITYTLLKLLKYMGDVALFTHDVHYKRLIDGAEIGELESIFVSANEYDPEDILDTNDMQKADFEHIIYDGIVPEQFDMFIYVSGCNQSEEEKETLDVIDNPITINLGYGNKCIPYSVRMFQSVEEIEGYKLLKEVDPNITKTIANLLCGPLGMPASNIRKVVARKR